MPDIDNFIKKATFATPNKKTFEMSPSIIMMISNGIMLLVIIVSLFVMNVSLKSSIDEKFAQISENLLTLSVYSAKMKKN